MLALLLVAVAVSSVPIEIKRVPASGTLRVAEPHGDPKPVRHGTLTVWFRHSSEWETQEVPIVDGAWSATVPHPCAGVDIGRVVVDRQEAYVSKGFWPDDPRAGRIDLVATLAKPVSLSVVDAAAGAPVTGFEVREWGSDLMGYPVPLAPDQGWKVADNAEGLVALPAWSLDPDPEFVPGVRWTPKRGFWVRARGLAWTRVDADFDVGGHVVAKLARESRLRIVTRATDARCWWELRMGADRRAGSIVLLNDGAEKLFTTLPAGPAELVLLDVTTGAVRVVERREVTLVAGEEVVVRL